MASPTDTLSTRCGAAAERCLVALCATRSSDAPAEERFGRLARLARRLANAPVALVSLGDADPEILPGDEGLPAAWTTPRAASLLRSFCRAIAGARLPLSTGDARASPRFADHPAVEALGIAAWLAAPLVSPDGGVVGALCAVDVAPRAWTGEDEQAFSDLAAVAAAGYVAAASAVRGGAAAPFDADGERRRGASAAAAAGAARRAEADRKVRVGPDGLIVRLPGARPRAGADGRRAEPAPRESGALLWLAQEAAAIGTWEWNPATGEGLWAPRRDAPSRPFLGEVVHPDDRAAVEAALREAAATGGAYEGVFRARRPRRGGGWEVRSVVARGHRALRADGSPGRFVGVTVDNTERLAAETRLRETQAALLHVSRLKAAGEAASALAHELDQPLTAAASAIGAARRMLARSQCAPDGGREIAGEVDVAVDLAAEQVLRAGRVVRRLRDFVGRGEADKRPADLRRLVEDACSLALAGAKERGISAEVIFEDALPPVFVDAIQVQQVLFNLVRNALEAMAAEAPVGAEARTRRDLVVSAAPTGTGAVAVAVADSGPGLAPAVAGRLFEPFVTTKRGGMGVGLSICRSIVEAHGGRLWAGPNPGGGAVFRFTLPAAPHRGQRLSKGAKHGDGGR